MTALICSSGEPAALGIVAQDEEEKVTTGCYASDEKQG